jgi:hypothetical protein
VQQYDAFERNDVKLQEDMKHAKALIKKQQVRYKPTCPLIMR